MGAVRGTGDGVPAHTRVVSRRGARNATSTGISPGVRMLVRRDHRRRLPGFDDRSGLRGLRRYAAIPRGGVAVGFAVGVDLGREADHSTIAVARDGAHDQLYVVHLHRFALGTSYLDVV